MKPVVQITNVSVSFQDGHRLAFPDATFHAGDRILLQGASGSGKTTLLRLLAGLEKPTIGALVTSAQRISYAFQEPRLIPQLTALDNVLIATGIDPHNAAQTLDRLNLAKVMHQRAKYLSGGEAQRVNLARALLARADLILLDEASSGLDEKTWRIVCEVTHSILRNTNSILVEVAHAPQKPLIDAAQAMTMRLDTIHAD